MQRIIDHEGMLCIQDEWAIEMDRPEKYAIVWPLGHRVAVAPHLVGKEVRYGGSDGVYYCPEYPSVRYTLENGGQTMPVHTITEPLKAPRGDWRYAYGEWINNRTGKRQRATFG